jgi:aromatic-amino-acid transaminase
MTRMVLPNGERSGDDPIFALNREAHLRKMRGERIINATVGVLLEDDGTLAILPSAAHAVREVKGDEWAAYAPISGNPEFLEAVMDTLFAGRPSLRAAATAVATPGGSGAIRHVVSTFLEPGQALLTTSLHWEPYSAFACEHQRRVETFDMFQDDQAREFNGRDFERRLAELVAAHGRAVVILNDPCHNPSGYSMTDRDWKVVSEVIERQTRRGSVVVLLDAAYEAYSPHGLGKAFDALEHLLGEVLVLVAWSASKTFTQYGLRVGCLVALVPEKEERRRVENALGYACRGTWSNCSRGGMSAVTRLLRDPALSQSVAQERTTLIHQLEQRVRAFSEIARENRLHFPRLDRGFFATVFLEDPDGSSLWLKERGVFVVPVRLGVRVALCSVPRSDIPRLVEHLAEVGTRQVDAR